VEMMAGIKDKKCGILSISDLSRQGVDGQR
jgi:hypothetical protein